MALLAIINFGENTMFEHQKIGDRELIKQVEMPESAKEALTEILAQNRMRELKQLLYEFTAVISGGLIALFAGALFFHLTGAEWVW